MTSKSLRRSLQKLLDMHEIVQNDEQFADAVCKLAFRYRNEQTAFNLQKVRQTMSQTEILNQYFLPDLDAA